ncbi:MAG: aminopeptidase P family protein [Hyphomicrobiaceae bacterium]
MYQSFDTNPQPDLARERVARLRTLLTGAKVEAFLIPRADEHQGEYVPPSAERLHWLTGFSGSAGTAIVAARKAAVLVDGRYTVQVRSEVNTKIFDLPAFAPHALATWIKENLSPGDKVGFDPWLHTVREIETLTRALADGDIRLKPVTRNLVDKSWGRDRPKPPLAPISLQPMKFAGQSTAKKLERLQGVLKSSGQSAIILTLPDSIAWLFNIRGADIGHNPVPLSFAIVPASGKARFFVAPEKLSDEVKTHLKSVARVFPPDALQTQVKELKKARKPVRLDPATAAWWFLRTLTDKNTSRQPDPCLAMKAIKNTAEIKGARTAHIRDGIAMVEFLHWVDANAVRGTVDEISAVEKLEACRRATGALRDISFDTISGSGPNGAIVHYRVSTTTNRKLRRGDLYLVDSGGQYQDGTTDITRTVAIGKPTDEMRDRFTRVLKGHIAIATARFPVGTRGVDLDPFARRALWDVGLDYGHGTGHGIGSYLSVHEGPQSISRTGVVALEAGMLCSNEPGYYKEGAYGIRIENVVLVTPANKPEDGDKPMLEFETLTLAPIDRKLIDKKLLTTEEREWINTYHAFVAKTLAPSLNVETSKWLASATKPL